MAGRLGQVLFWAATLISALMIGLVVYARASGPYQGDTAIQTVIVFLAVVIWLVGWTLRFIVTGR
jgi:hypothetical protein